MTAPDAVVNAPTEIRHREEAARLTGSNSHNTKRWVETGDFSLICVSKNTKYYRAVRHAQSLANLEAAVRREYSELQHLAASAARMLRDGDERDVSGRIFKELENLKNG